MTQLPMTGRRRPWLRLLMLIVAFALTALGIYWIGVSGSTTRNRVGFPVALWGVLIGAYALHGTRWTQLPVEVAAPAEAVLPGPGDELELRRSGEVEPAGESERRREYQLQLEVMLRREMEKVLRQELAALRADVAGLRGEVLDAVDGRLRLERIETTRIIGSDLAALQNEVRRLNLEREAPPVGRAVGDVAVITRENGTVIEPAGSSGMRRETDLWTPSSAASTGVLPEVSSTRPGARSESRPNGPAPNDWPASTSPAPTSSAPTRSAPGTPAGNQRPPLPARATTSPLVDANQGVAPRPVAASSPAESAAPAAPGAPAASTRPNPPTSSAPPTRGPFDSDPFAGLPRLSAFHAADEPAAPVTPAVTPAPPPGPPHPSRVDYPSTSDSSTPPPAPTPTPTPADRAPTVTARDVSPPRRATDAPSRQSSQSTPATAGPTNPDQYVGRRRR